MQLSPPTTGAAVQGNADDSKGSYSAGEDEAGAGDSGSALGEDAGCTGGGFEDCQLR